MQINIRTSEKNLEVVRQLTAKLPHGTKENVIARIALGYSLQSGTKFSSQEFGKYDSKGKEYKDHILFDEKYRDFYIALICQHYGLYKSDEDIPRYFKLHIDHGLELMDNIFQNNFNYTFIDFLSDHLEKGIDAFNEFEVSLDHVNNRNQGIDKSYFINPLKIVVGEELETAQGEMKPIELYLNNTEQYNNCHIAIAGNSGTGKTQFALEFLSQISKKSNGHVNFIYLDFKGLKNEDIVNMEPFFQGTQSEFIDVPNRKFPVNPLTFIDNINQVDRNLGIDKFVDIVCKYSNLGYRQKAFLREATTQAFFEQKAGTYPNIPLINEKLQEIYEKKDSLTEIIDDLSRYEIFEDDPKNQANFLNKNIYLSLSGDLSNSVRFTSLFLIVNYIYNTFMNMENTPVEHNNKGIRYVVLIDEAHVVFKERKYQEILEKMLREIRSKGVAVVLLSQGIEEYNQKDFDFSSMCEIAFLLDIKDKNVKLIEKFMGFSPNMGTKVARCMEKIEKGQAIANIKEFEKAKLFKINQYWENKLI
jgi:DNA sulfur modification protein DndE